MEKKENNTFIDGLFTVIKHDSIYIVLIILALGACAWTIMHVGDYVDECNERWTVEMDKLVCYSKETHTGGDMFEIKSDSANTQKPSTQIS